MESVLCNVYHDEETGTNMILCVGGQALLKSDVGIYATDPDVEGISYHNHGSLH